MSAFDRLLPIIPLTEPERRRREFAGGTAIVLPDGAPWRFFEPAAVVREVNDGADGGGVMIVWDFGEDLDATTNDSLGQGFQRLLAKIDRASSDTDRACAVLEVAWFLLARNYVINREEFEELLLRGTKRREIELLKRLVAGVTERLAALAERSHGSFAI